MIVSRLQDTKEVKSHRFGSWIREGWGCLSTTLLEKSADQRLGHVPPRVDEWGTVVDTRLVCELHALTF